MGDSFPQPAQLILGKEARIDNAVKVQVPEMILFAQLDLKKPDPTANVCAKIRVTAERTKESIEAFELPGEIGFAVLDGEGDELWPVQGDEPLRHFPGDPANPY